MTDLSGALAPTTSTANPADDNGKFLERAAVYMVVLVIVLIFTLVILSGFGLKFDTTLIAFVSSVLLLVGGFAGTVFGWRFGSSKGSQDKNATIASLSVLPPTQ